jgi:hypothetical protein
MHGIGTWEPPAIHLTVRRDSRITLPAYPPIKLYTFSGPRFEMGIVEKTTGAGIVQVYDREKTISDVVHFRNSIGFDIAMEALREYLKGHGKDITRLLDYTKLLRIEGTIRGYLEVLV